MLHSDYCQSFPHVEQTVYFNYLLLGSSHTSFVNLRFLAPFVESKKCALQYPVFYFLKHSYYSQKVDMNLSKFTKCDKQRMETRYLRVLFFFVHTVTYICLHTSSYFVLWWVIVSLTIISDIIISQVHIESHFEWNPKHRTPFCNSDTTRNTYLTCKLVSYMSIIISVHIIWTIFVIKLYSYFSSCSCTWHVYSVVLFLHVYSRYTNNKTHTWILFYNPNSKIQIK